jgi:hypothetical protein
MDVNIYLNGKPVTAQQQRELTVKNEVVSRIVHNAAARYEQARLERNTPGGMYDAGE